MRSGDMIGERYYLKEVLGQGGNGIVYLALDGRLYRSVAVKILPAKDAEQFKREIDLQKELHHPMLPVVSDVIETQSECCIVMEYINGVTLDEYLEKNGAMEEGQAVKIALQLLDVLEYLHTRRPPVIYQDLKPANIMLCPDGSVKLIDFGTSAYRYYDGRKVTAAGTKGYASPEQLAGDGRRIGIQSDLYAFGAVLYSMVTGIRLQYPPYRMDPVRALFPHVSKRIADVIEQCTAESMSERFKDARDVERAVSCGAFGEDVKRLLPFHRKMHGTSHKKKTARLHYTARVKSVFLSAKKHAGLWGVILLLGIVQPAAGNLRTVFQNMLLRQGIGTNSVLPVTVYNEQGQKVLIRYGSVYDLRGDFRLEIPGESFLSDTAATLKITVSGPLGEVRRERTFLLRSVQ